jgi:hypothetical protein
MKIGGVKVENKKKSIKKQLEIKRKIPLLIKSKVVLKLN